MEQLDGTKKYIEEQNAKTSCTFSFAKGLDIDWDI